MIDFLKIAEYNKFTASRWVLAYYQIKPNWRNHPYWNLPVSKKDAGFIFKIKNREHPSWVLPFLFTSPQAYIQTSRKSSYIHCTSRSRCSSAVYSVYPYFLITSSTSSVNTFFSCPGGSWISAATITSRSDAFSFCPASVRLYASTRALKSLFMPSPPIKSALALLLGRRCVPRR